MGTQPTAERRRHRGSLWWSCVSVSLCLCGLSFGHATSVRAQEFYLRGQSVVPVYEGWEKNGDGSFNLVFGYFNRNWDEQLDVRVGPDNQLDPGGTDQGQPTHFYPRRNRFSFRVRVPADFGKKEVV